MATYGYNPNFPTSQGSGIPEKSFGAGPGGLLGAYLQMQQILRARDQQEQAGKERSRMIEGVQGAQGYAPKAIEALLRAGTPEALILAEKLKGLLPKPIGPEQIGAGGLRLPSGEIISPATKPPQERPYSIGAGGLRLPSGEVVPPVSSPNTAVTPVEIADPNDPTKAIKVDARSGKRIGSSPPKAPVVKPLPSPLQKQLTDISAIADAATRFNDTFQDSYGGKTITGDLSNVTGRYFGDETGQSQWWQDYELHQSQVRNKLFGSALTESEIIAWNKSAINARMDSEQIKTNLDRRNKLEQTAIKRLMKGASVIYSKDQIEAFTGRSIDGGTQQPATYIEIRVTPGGKRLGKKADGTIEEIK